MLCVIYILTCIHTHTHIYIYRKGPYPFSDHFRGEFIIVGITIKILGRSLFKTWGIKLFTIKVVSTIKLRTCQILVIWNIRILHCRNVTIQTYSNWTISLHLDFALYVTNLRSFVMFCLCYMLNQGSDIFRFVEACQSRTCFYCSSSPISWIQKSDP